MFLNYFGHPEVTFVSLKKFKNYLSYPNMDTSASENRFPDIRWHECYLNVIITFSDMFGF